MNSKNFVVSGVIMSICVLAVYAILRSNMKCNVTCDRAIISWYEDLERDDMPREPRSSPVVIDNRNKAQALYNLFSSQKSNEMHSAGWAGCVDVRFEFSCGHTEFVFIDNALANWTGLDRSGDQPVPVEFLDIFTREFEINRESN